RVVVAGFYPPDVLEGWLGAKLVKQKLTLKPLLSARSGVLTVDVDENQETRLELVVDFPEQTPAGPNQAAIEAALALLEKQLREFLATLAAMGTKAPPSSDFAWLNTFPENLRRAEMRREGSTLTASIRVGDEPSVIVASLGVSLGASVAHVRN